MADRETNLTNFFSTTLDQAVNPADLTFTVVSTAGGPASPAYIVINPEDPILREVIYSDDTFSGTTFATTDLSNRDLDSNGNLSHDIGATVWVSWLAQHAEDVNDRVTALAAGVIHADGTVPMTGNLRFDDPGGGIEFDTPGGGASSMRLYSVGTAGFETLVLGEVSGTQIVLYGGESGTAPDSIFFVVNGTTVASFEGIAGLKSVYPMLFPGGSAAAPALTFTADTDTGIYRIADEHIGFAAGGSHAFGVYRESGNPGQALGNSAGNASRPAFSFDGDTDTGIYRAGADSLVLVVGGSLLYAVNLTATTFGPATSNSITLGSSTFRWKEVWTNAGAINTSDEATKDNIADSDLGLDFIKALRPIAYRFKDGARTHYGFGAEQVREALDAVGVDDAAFYIDPKVGAEKAGKPKKKDYASSEEHAAAVEQWEAELAAPKGLRYSELIGPLVKAMQEQQAQIDALTARLDALEG